MAPNSRRGKGCTVRLKGKTFVVTFRDPRRSGRVVRASLKTSDSKVADSYKHDLDRVISDENLWNQPHETCAVRVREIWLGDTYDVEVDVGGEKVRVRAAPGENRPWDVEPADTDELGVFDPRKVSRSNGPQFKRLDGDYDGASKARSAAVAVRELTTELNATRTQLERARADLEEAQRSQKILRQRLSQYERRKIKEAEVGTLEEEAQKFLADYGKRKLHPKRLGIVTSAVNRFVAKSGGTRKADDVTPEEVSRYVETYRQESGAAISEQHRTTLRYQLCTFLETATSGVFDRREVRTVKSHAVRREQKAIIWLESKEVDALLKAMYALGEYWGDVATIQARMGWRPSELIILQKQCVGERVITLEPVVDETTGFHYGKTGGRSVQIPLNARTAVRRRLEAPGSPLLFPRLMTRDAVRQRKGTLETAWTQDNFCTVYLEHLQQAAVAAKISKHVDSRTLRRTFGSLLLRQKRTPYEVAKLMGDRPATVERHYASILAGEIDTNLV